MTIDLGFAWLRLPSGRQISIVDVPGHERFIKNMLAGVGCIDAAILVIAANDGVMPQTREHLSILDLLQVSSGVVAVTKIDLVDSELLDMAIQEARAALAGTTLANAALVPVSVVSGQGLSQFVTTLDQVLVGLPVRANLERPRLWIDRVFTVTGFGTVVTGTLIDGVLRMGQAVEILPAGRQSRIRAMETHKRSLEVAQPGTRVAVNLPDLRVDDVKRGDVLSLPGCLKPTKRLDARLRCLPNVPGGLKDKTIARLFVGSADVEVKVRLLDAEAIAPGETGLAQLSLTEPTVVARGDHFVLRHSAISLTLGGGVVIDPYPLRHTRHRASIIAALETMERGDPPEVLRRTLGDKRPVEVRRLLEWTGLTLAELSQAVDNLISAREVIVLGADPHDALPAVGVYLVSQAGWQRLLDEMTRLVRDHHRRYPLRRGMPKEDLRSRLDMEADLFPHVVSQAVQARALVEDITTVRLPDFQVKLTPEQEERAHRLLQAHRQSPYAPPTISVAAREYGVDAELLRVLIDRGDLVKVGDEEVFMRPVYDEMVVRITQWIKREGSITVAQVRELIPDATRRYVMALLNHLDEIRITRRIGDERVLR